MAVKIAIESFLAVVRRSRLIESEKLDALLAAYQQNAGENDAHKFADFLVARKALTAWQAEKLLQGKHKGFFLGKYRLLSLVGKGGMSSVYLAEHVVMRRRCAIKVLPTRKLQNASYLARFHREAQAVASLDHPNIVRAYDVDHARDGDMEIHFLVMEFVDGKGLLDLVLSSPQTRLPPVVAAEYIRQAALGLQHAHTAGLVHRDIKPGNLLVDRRGTVKVLDLGLARFFETGDDTSLTVQHDERVLGTADYLAPEQAVDSHNVDARADIYSLGCTLYLCLTGQPPFTHGTLAQRLLAHQTREPPAVESVQPEVPPELAKIVRKMMAKDPNQRYQTAGDVAAALEVWLKGVPRTDQDRSYAGLDHATPVPEAGPLDSTPAAPAETVRGGSLADVSSTPHVEPRRSSSSSLRREQRKTNRPVSTPPAATQPQNQPAFSNSDQDTIVGGPPWPTAADEDSLPMQEELFGAIQDVESPAEGGTSLAIEIPMEDDPIVRRPVRKRQNALADLLDGWQDRRRQTSLIWGGVALGALLVLMLVVWAMREPTKVAGPPPVPPPHQTPPADARADLGPVLVVGDAGDFATIGEALKHIQEHRQRYTDTPSWTVKVAGGRTYPEAIVISNSGMSGEAFPAGVEIVSDGEASAVLRPAGTEPVVELDGVARLTLRGFVLDGTGRETVLRLAGFLVGTRLENLQLRELNGAGIQWDDIVCLPEAPLELVNLHFDGEGAAAVGVRMGDTRQVRYDRCVFTGPMAAGIEFTADVWNTGVSVRHSRFFDVQTGLRFTGNAQDIQRVSVVNNTFHSVQHALAWDHMPQAGSSGLLVHHNLFARMSGPAAIIREGFDPSRAQELLAEGGALNNWTDRPADSAAGGVAILDLFERGERAVQNLSFESTDPASPGFLKPTAPPVTIELKSRAQEADPIVGAIAP